MVGKDLPTERLRLAYHLACASDAYLRSFIISCDTNKGGDNWDSLPCDHARLHFE